MQRIIDDFHRLYYASGVWQDTTWLGVPVQKCPLDLWIYQEILAALRPDLVVETGTAHGGSALFVASVCGLLAHGEVMSIDVEDREGRPRHPRLTYVHGSSVDADVVAAVQRRAAGRDRVLVLLDADHTEGHVAAELAAYAPLVTPGSLLIVEDTNVNGHPVLPLFGPGPHEAVDAFLRAHPEFVRDRRWEKLALTFNPGGFLRRSAP